MNKLNTAKNVDTSAEELDNITNSLLEKADGTYTKEDIDTLKALLFNQNLSSTSLEKCIFELSYRLIYTTTQIPDLKYDINKQFKYYTKLRIEMKKHSNITQAILDKFDSDLSIKYVTDVKELEKLSKSEDPFMRTLTAHNPKTAKDVLDKLSYDKNDIVRLASLKHKNMTTEMLERFSKDDAIDIKIIVAKNLETTALILAHMVLTDDSNLDNAIENNNNVSDETLDIIKARRENIFNSLIGF